MKVSACVITKNEEQNIARCLQSVQNAVDEMIVVDTGSSDQTVEIAKQFGAKVYFFKWINDFAAARNFALRKAKGEWIIFLDADEYFTPESTGNIRPYLRRIHRDQRLDGIFCRMMHLDAEGQVYSYNPAIRIFRNQPSIKYHEKIHEHLMKKGKKLNTVLDNEHLLTIYHTGYAGEAIYQKVARNLELLENDLENNDTGTFTHYYLGASYATQGMHEEALRYMSLALEKDSVGGTPLAYKQYTVLISSMMALVNQHGLAAIGEKLKEGLGRFPKHPEVWALQAAYHKMCKDYSKALEAYIYAVQLHDNYTDEMLANEFQTIRGRVHYEIATIYLLMNDNTNALDYLVKALHANKYNTKPFCDLMFIIRRQQRDNIIAFLNSIYNETNQEDIAFLVNQLSILKMGEVLAYYQNIWQVVFKCQDLTGVVTLLSNGEYAVALEHFTAYFHQTKDEQGQLFAVVAAMLGEDRAILNDRSFEYPYTEIAATYLGAGDCSESLGEQELPVYLELIAEFAYMATPEQMARILAVKKRFCQDLSEEIGDQFFQHRSYQQALGQYADKLERQSASPGLFFKIGVCFFYLQDYWGSISCWERAVDSGYQETDIVEYLDWTIQQSKDEQIIQAAHGLKLLVEAAGEKLSRIL